MKALLTTGALAAATLFTGCAQLSGLSDANRVAIPAVASAQPAGLSRAEVLADLQMWRLAGMDDYARREGQDFPDGQYRAALARYQSLRASPAFSDLVSRLAENPGTLAVLR